MIPIVLVFGLPYCLIWNPTLDVKNILHNLVPIDFGMSFFSVFILFVLGIVVHELIHGITWVRFAKNGFKSIKFGILWKMLTPYCHCMEPLKVRQYRIGAITPAIFLCFIPSIITLIVGNLGLLIFGIFFTMAAAGDFLVIQMISKEKRDDLVEDHPSEAGCYIYRKIENKTTEDDFKKLFLEKELPFNQPNKENEIGA